MLAVILLFTSLVLALALWWPELERPRTLVVGLAVARLGATRPPPSPLSDADPAVSPAHEGALRSAFLGHQTYVPVSFTCRVMKRMPPYPEEPEILRYQVLGADGTRVELVCQKEVEFDTGARLGVSGTYVWTGRGGLVYETSPPNGEVRVLDQEG